MVFRVIVISEMTLFFPQTLKEKGGEVELSSSPWKLRDVKDLKGLRIKIHL